MNRKGITGILYYQSLSPLPSSSESSSSVMISCCFSLRSVFRTVAFICWLSWLATCHIVSRSSSTALGTYKIVSRQRKSRIIMMDLTSFRLWAFQASPVSLSPSVSDALILSRILLFGGWNHPPAPSFWEEIISILKFWIKYWYQGR